MSIDGTETLKAARATIAAARESPSPDAGRSVDKRFDAELQRNFPNGHHLRSLYWEMKAELAEDLGFYLGRLKTLEDDNARLRDQMGRLVLALAGAVRDKSDADERGSGGGE